ncbi:MAG: hypothetical protein ACI391_05430 [Muribaculaceae bacterium]
MRYYYEYQQKLGLPMDKTSTQTLNRKARSNFGINKPSPKAVTIAFLRQFARAYCPAANPALAGIVLN